ncbi:MAG: hypothetical protein E6G06_07385 [Actinobacteria bacterium]|nr:MAG: hypothetical protein E6G06_07385 [Actinomycetota bacterium]
MKPSSFRRVAACVAMMGAGALGLPAGPAGAHQWNGNPAAPADPVDGRHDVSVKSGGVEKTVSLVRSKADGCSFNTSPYGPACATPSIVDVSAPTFGGTPNQNVTVLLCNAKRVAPTGQGGDGDLQDGCDFANGRGLGSVSTFPTSSGTFTLDGSGNLPGTIPLTLTSCNGATGSLVPDVLTSFGLPTCNNGNATSTCPPTQGQILSGWTCVVPVAEFDPVQLTPGAHIGFRVFNMKSPIPAKLCNGGACGATVPAGATVQLTGVRFPCKTIQPDDPVAAGNQAACLVAHGNKTILVKRTSTGTLEGGAITPTSQTAGLNGDYTITFPMPDLLHDGELYKVVPHAQDCIFNQGASTTDPNFPNSCESGKFNAAGTSVKQ